MSGYHLTLSILFEQHLLVFIFIKARIVEGHSTSDKYLKQHCRNDSRTMLLSRARFPHDKIASICYEIINISRLKYLS